MRSSSTTIDHPTMVQVRNRGTVLDGAYAVDEAKTAALLRQVGSCGQGSMMVVRLNHGPDAVNCSDASHYFALKLPISEEHVAGIRREIALWADLAPHPHIAVLHDIGCEGELPALLTPLATLGSLESYIHGLPQPPPEAEITYEVEALQEPLCFGLQISCGLEFLHHRAVLHSDLKPKNVLVYNEAFNRDVHVRLKICDLGYSVGAERDPNGMLVGRRLGRGTGGYAPPELRERKSQHPITDRCDTWGLVMCLLFAIHGCLPDEVTSHAPSERRDSFLAACQGGGFEHAGGPCARART